mgnify:CR=1 FL=1
MPIHVPFVIGHRGAAGLAPENTMVSLRRARLEGARWVEFDVMLSRDGVPLLFHDDTLNRTTNGKGLIAKHDFKDLRELDAGSWFNAAFAGERIPSFAETIEMLATEGLGANVEIKPTPGRARETAEAACRMITENWPVSIKLVISSFEQDAMAVARDMLPDRDRARAVALLQQSQTIVNRLTVRELVGFGRWPHHQGRPGPEDARLTQAALETFELDQMADRALETLSGGQRQRAQVAMVWAQSTPWLLLDEPLNALDPKYARDLMHRLHELTRPGPEARSVVVVLHDINAAATWADRVVAMKDGRLHASGESANILTPGGLGELYEPRFDVLDHEGRPVVVSR